MSEVSRERMIADVMARVGQQRIGSDDFVAGQRRLITGSQRLYAGQRVRAQRRNAAWDRPLSYS